MIKVIVISKETSRSIWCAVNGGGSAVAESRTFMFHCTLSSWMIATNVSYCQQTKSSQFFCNLPKVAILSHETETIVKKTEAYTVGIRDIIGDLPPNKKKSTVEVKRQEQKGPKRAKKNKMQEAQEINTETCEKR